MKSHFDRDENLFVKQLWKLLLFVQNPSNVFLAIWLITIAIGYSGCATNKLTSAPKTREHSLYYDRIDNWRSLREPLPSTRLSNPNK